jgi:hypothetical protein
MTTYDLCATGRIQTCTIQEIMPTIRQWRDEGEVSHVDIMPTDDGTMDCVEIDLHEDDDEMIIAVIAAELGIII